MNFDDKIEQWSDRINPVLVKELRQTVRSGVLLSSLLSVATLIMLALFVHLGMVNQAESLVQPQGRMIFLWLVNLLFFFCLIIVPMNAGIRLIREIYFHNTELFYASPLSAGQIIRGKLASGSYLVFLFFSICAPFLFVTSLLRGIDILSIVVVLILGFLVIVAELQVALLVCTLNIRRVARGIIGVVVAVFTLPVAMALFGSGTALVVFNGPGELFNFLLSENGLSLLLVVGWILGVAHALSITFAGRIYGQGQALLVVEIGEKKYHF